MTCDCACCWEHGAITGRDKQLVNTGCEITVGPLWGAGRKNDRRIVSPTQNLMKLCGWHQMWYCCWKGENVVGGGCVESDVLAIVSILPSPSVLNSCGEVLETLQNASECVFCYGLGK